MHGLGTDINAIKRRVRFCDYLTVAQLFLQDNFLLSRALSFSDVKPRLLGHWGTCHGINVAYANLRTWHEVALPAKNLRFVLGPGHGYPALQANLFFDGELAKYDERATRTLSGIEYICRQFSWPYGFPSHSSPLTPGVIAEGGELGYALAASYGASLRRPDDFIAVMIGDGEMETATALASLNLHRLVDSPAHGRVLPILHLNGYKISGPTIYGRISEREMMNTLRGFGYEPVIVDGENTEEFQMALLDLRPKTFVVMRTAKGATGPEELHGEKIAGNYLAHQIPLPEAKSDSEQLAMLEKWLVNYHFRELYDEFTR